MISCLDKSDTYKTGIMTTNKRMKHFYISNKLAEKLEDYRHACHIRSESLAVQRLLFKALKDYGAIAPDAVEQDYV